MIGQAHLRTFRTRDLPGPYACAEPINGPLQEENAETIADEQQPRNRRQNANRDGRGWKRSNAPADRFRTQFQTSFGGGHWAVNFAPSKAFDGIRVQVAPWDSCVPTYDGFRVSRRRSVDGALLKTSPSLSHFLG